MGRRKIEIKAIKDDRNRSVTFLKRKGGLFKKAHELSVLCCVDVAVFIFGNNKKLYEYSSTDMREMITRYTYALQHGGPNEHKGPQDFQTAAADDEEEDDDNNNNNNNNGTPPQNETGMESQMVVPPFQPQAQFPPQIRHQHAPSLSPPMPNGAVFGAHPANAPRGHTPQPQIGSRPASRNDIRRMPPNMVTQPVVSQAPPQPVNGGYAYMPQPAIYNPQNASLPPSMPTHGLPQPHPQFPYSQPAPQPPQMQPFVEDQRRPQPSPAFPPPHTQPTAPRHSLSPPQPPAPQLPAQFHPQPVTQMSAAPSQPQQPSAQPQQQSQPTAHQMQTPPQPQQQLPSLPPPQETSHNPEPTRTMEPPQIQQPASSMPPPHESQPPAPLEPKPIQEPERRQPTLLLDTNIKRLPPRGRGSIFTPIDENRSVLSQHLAAFAADKSSPPEPKPQPVSTSGSNNSSPSNGQRSNPQIVQPPQITRTTSLSSTTETVFTPPSRSNSLRTGGPLVRPRLKVQIPDESDNGSATGSASPKGTTTTNEATSQPSRLTHCSTVVLPPPSPSASALLSAGATGPPNPFARPLPQQNSNRDSIDTPVSALPSRFLNTDYLPSPSSFYPEWNLRGSDSNTLPSPLNFATPVVGTGPSFLRDDPAPPPSLLKRKSPEISGSNGNSGGEGSSEGNDAKRLKVEAP